jgi:hypothetical protein
MTKNPSRMIDACNGLFRRPLVGNVRDQPAAVLDEKQVDLD